MSSAQCSLEKAVSKSMLLEVLNDRSRISLSILAEYGDPESKTVSSEIPPCSSGVSAIAPAKCFVFGEKPSTLVFDVSVEKMK